MMMINKMMMMRMMMRIIKTNNRKMRNWVSWMMKICMKRRNNQKNKRIKNYSMSKNSLMLKRMIRWSSLRKSLRKSLKKN